MRVTFDTNSLDRACRPGRFPKDPQHGAYRKVHDALRAGHLEGYFPVTMLTIEGIARADRASVYASSRVDFSNEQIRERSTPQPEAVEAGDLPVISVRATFTVSQPARRALHPEIVRRLDAALGLGLKALRPVPRLGAFHLTDEQQHVYAPFDDLESWLEYVFEVARALDDRGIGAIQARQLGERLAARTGKPWYQGFVEAADIHDTRAVERAFSEWADGDALASHIAHGFDIFCTSDIGGSNALPSVLDPPNRTWLTSEYGLRIFSIEELANWLP